MPNKSRLLNLGLLLSAAVPVAIAAAICGHMLYIVWPDLKPEQQQGFLSGLALVIAPGAMAAVISLVYLRRGMRLPVSWLVTLLGVLIFCFYADLRFVQPQVFLSDWVFDQGTYMTVIASGLIPLFYFIIFCIASAFAITGGRSLFYGILATVLVPAGAYFGFNLVRMGRMQDPGGHIWQMLFIVLTTAFSFFLLRLMIYIGARNLDRLQNPRIRDGLNLLFIGILPCLGLLLNAYGPVARESQMVIGTFTAPGFWLLTIVNAILYLLPVTKSQTLNLILTALRATGFSFVLYFCVVFLLFLPLALILIVVIGLGFLLLIPYFAAALQIIRLRADILELARAGRKGAAIAALIFGLLLLPAAVLAHIYADRATLTAAIRFLQQPPLTLNQRSPIDARKILALAKPQETNRRGFMHTNRQLPIYDSLYRSIVLDGAELAEPLRKKINLVFGGVNEFVKPAQRSGMSTAQLGETRISAKEADGLTQSTLRVKITNGGNRVAEFSERIELPDGAFITGHWLKIDGVEVPAQITTKNTAIWVYNRVTERMRDPSLIYYEGKNALRWKVFPVPAAGFREARLQISHLHDVAVTVAGKKIPLAARSQAATVIGSATGRTQLIGRAPEGTTLKRRPYLHLIADCSKNARKDYLNDAKEAARQLRQSLQNAKISFVNSSILTRDFTPYAAVTCPEMREGFFLDMTLRSIAHTHHLTAADTFPVMVVLSPDRLAANGEELSFIGAFSPDIDGFFRFDGKKIESYDFSGNISTPKLSPVRLHSGRYVSSEPTLVIGTTTKALPSPLLDGVERYYDYYLGKAASRAPAVISAIETGVLNPATGSIVLETEAQRRKLADLHKKFLDARNELDTGEQPRMSEPWGFIFLAGLFFLFLFFFRRSEQKPPFPGI